MEKKQSKQLVLSVAILMCGLIMPSFVHADDLQEISQNITSTPDQIAKGKTVFMSNCMTCHGSEGKGDGPAAAAFNPKPRNFTAEKFKQGSSPSATFYTVTNGMGSMPSFAALSVSDRLAAIHFVLSLSPNREKDTPDTLSKIGLGPDLKPLANFNSNKAPELPIDYIIERMSTDGNVKTLDYKLLAKQMEEEKKAAATPVAQAPVQADLKRGKVLFESCTICHGDNGEGTKLATAPQIAGQDVDYLMRQLKNFQTGVRGAHPDDVNGLKMRPMSRMLQTEEDVINVAHYVASLPNTKTENTLGGDKEKGKITYNTCMSCHGADAKGSKAMNAPMLKYLPDWYIMTQIHNFQKGIRGTDSRDTNGATMRGMAASLATDDMIKDVAAYIQSLQ
ncbi:c-type cytochrome [bacterium]|nr:c-type cytochrome [bacterium]